MEIIEENPVAIEENPSIIEETPPVVEENVTESFGDSTGGEIIEEPPPVEKKKKPSHLQNRLNHPKQSLQHWVVPGL